MKYQVYFAIAIRIIVLFGIGFMWTFITPAISKVFGDSPCLSKNGCGFDGGIISWGTAHYWYWWCMFLLFILSLVNVIVGIVKAVNKHYPNL